MTNKEEGVKEAKKMISMLKKGIRADKKLIKYYEANEEQYPHLKGAKKVSLEAIARYTAEIEEWQEELLKLKKEE